MISSLSVPATPLSKITSGRKNKHWKTLSRVCKPGLFPLPCSCSLKGAAAPVRSETSASSAHSWPCLADPRQKTSVFIWRLLRHLIQLEIKGKEMCFEIEPSGRQRHQHANATRKWVQDEAPGSIPVPTGLCLHRDPAKPLWNLGGVWACVCEGKEVGAGCGSDPGSK